MENQNLIRKTIIFTIIIFCTISTYGQNITEKWNSLYDRYEYFDSYGSFIAYKKYNSLYKRWEYYDLKTNNNSNEGYKVVQPPQLVDIELARNVLDYKQNRYDNNFAKIKNFINKSIREMQDHINECTDEKSRAELTNILYMYPLGAIIFVNKYS